MPNNVATLPSSLGMELYHLREAARLLSLPTITMRRWLEGGTVSGTFYGPVIREEPTGSDIVTWGEFVEAGLLREYRKKKEVPMQRMRPFIAELRRMFETTYPLAEFRPVVDSNARNVLLAAQSKAGLKEEDVLLHRVGPRNHAGGFQLQWAEPMREFLEKVDFDHEGIAQRMFPLGPARRVTIDPNVVFGIPQVGGIRTEILRESYAELGSEEAVAEEWEIDIKDVQAAMQWEASLRAA